MEGQSKKLVVTLISAFVFLILAMLLRPFIVGQIASSAQPYNIDVYNATSETYDKVTVTPDATLSYKQADRMYSIFMFIYILIALAVLILEATGKL